MKTTIHFSLITVHLVLAANAALAQGSLTPPGPPAPTFKTLQQIEPRIDLQNAPASAVTTTDFNYHFIINQPGSYYLSANIAVNKTNGIQINAENVSLDLNGFELSHLPGGVNGIQIAAVGHGVSIRNGSLKGFASGIQDVGGARGAVLRDLAVSGCTGTPIQAPPGSVLESCRVFNNVGGSNGIFTGSNCSLSNCVASNNTVTSAIQTGIDCVLSNCIAAGNTGTYGIIAGVGSSLLNCSASSNTSAATTSAGFNVGGGGRVSHCVAEANTSTAAVPTSSTGMGFQTGSGTLIEGCTARLNRGDGILCGLGSTVRQNQCYLNGSGGDGAGIHTASNRCRIEDNNVISNDRGIDIDATANIIIKNSASANPGNNYDILAGNSFGPLVNVSGVGDISATVGADHPWANFAY